MPLSTQQRDQIANLLIEQIRRKLSEYSPETTGMPFHVRLLGQNRMALFSFIHSINTMLGMSIFEHVAAIIAAPHFRRTIHQYKGLSNTISENALATIQRIVEDLRATRAKPDKPSEIAEILSVAQTGVFRKIKRPRVDIFLESWDGTEYYFDIKTAKPNVDDIVGYKRKLLEWVAIRGAVSPPTKIYTGLAMAYNPYEPQSYDRWTFQGMLDIPHELKVAEEFWDFLGGENTYEELLQIFTEVGIQLQSEIDARFASFAP